MLAIPINSESTTSIVGIDPGSNQLGISVLIVDIATMEILQSNAWTIVGAKLAGKESWLEETHGARLSRIRSIEENLYKVFCIYRPYLVGCESPFISRAFPQAGIVLTEVLTGIRRAVIEYDPWCTLHLIDPPTVKIAVKAAGNAPKDVMMKKLMALTDIRYCGDVPMECLDEHSIDALAVAYATHFQYKLKRGYYG